MASPSPTNHDLIHEAIDQFWINFPPVWHRIRGNVRSIATENYDITVEQFHILRHLRRGVHSISELAEEKQTSRSAVSQAVEVLVEKGLVTRREKSGDRRFVHIELSEQGTGLLKAIFDQNRSWMLEKLTSLETTELENIVQALQSLKRAFIED
jgi:MarR family transcriptional regulator, 2-MHQ and catechol-resistance regulon repressor